MDDSIKFRTFPPTLKLLEYTKVQRELSTLLTFWREDLTVQLVFLVVLLLSLSHAGLPGVRCGDAHLGQVLCVPLCHPRLSQLLLLLIDVADTARYHGINHRCLFGEDL